jgi:fatty acyl-CoA reductase
MRKVVLITGDFEKPGLGLIEGDRSVLVREVDVIFHCAATVRFNAKLWNAVSINILGTKYMLDMAREMPHLKVSHCISYSPFQSNIKIKNL